jgi:competence CoiA-like predicted nuclease
MKIAFLEQGCEVEKTIDIDGKKYRADAMHGKTVFEFANTISKSYEKKTVDLLAAGYRVVWVLNSTANVSYSETTVFLKGAMYNLANVMEHLGSEVWLHVCGQLVKVDHEKFYKSYGIKNAFRFLRFITRGHGFWPWDQIENNGNNDDFFTDDLSNTIPICYNAQDCAEVKL